MTATGKIPTGDWKPPDGDDDGEDLRRGTVNQQPKKAGTRKQSGAQRKAGLLQGNKA